MGAALMSAKGASRLGAGALLLGLVATLAIVVLVSHKVGTRIREGTTVNEVMPETDFTEVEKSKPASSASKLKANIKSKVKATIKAKADKNTDIVRDFEKKTKDLTKKFTPPEFPEKQAQHQIQIRKRENKKSETAADALHKLAHEHANSWSRKVIQDDHDGTGVPGTPITRANAKTKQAGDAAAQILRKKWAAAKKVKLDKKASNAEKEENTQRLKKRSAANARQKVWDKINDSKEAERRKEEAQTAEEDYYDKKLANKDQDPEAYKNANMKAKVPILSFLQAAAGLRK